MTIFTDKIAIITGAASGIGRALGVQLAQRGAVAVMADIQANILEETVDSITHRNGKARAVTLDVTDLAAVDALVNNTAGQYGRLDYIFNNAGIAVGGEAVDFSIDDWRNVLDVNLRGVIYGVFTAYPLMVEQGFGHIINTASIEGLIPFPGTASYVASKYGVVGLSNALRIEGADLGVKVSVVCPGYIKTAIFHTSKLINIDRKKMLESLPERFGISPDKCASVILLGVEQNTAIIVVTGFAKILWLLHRLHPGLIFWMMRRRMKEAREKLRIT